MPLVEVAALRALATVLMVLKVALRVLSAQARAPYPLAWFADCKARALACPRRPVFEQMPAQNIRDTALMNLSAWSYKLKGRCSFSENLVEALLQLLSRGAVVYWNRATRNLPRR